MRCPHCGRSINQKTHTFENRVKRPFKVDTLAPTYPQMSGGLVKEQPAGLPSMDTHVKIPFRQTMIYGLFDAPVGVAIGLGAGLSAALLVDAASLDSLTLSAYALVIGGGGLLGGTVSFCRAAKREWPNRLNVYDALLWIEEVTGLDLDGDGEIGEPEQARTIPVEFTEKGVPREIDTLEIDMIKAVTLARLLIIEGKSFSERTAADAGLARAEEWVPLREKLISRRWAKWNHPTNPKGGVSLTPKGVALFQAILNQDGGLSLMGSTHPAAPTHANGNNYERYEPIER
jgi:hypothetical protein